MFTVLDKALVAFITPVVMTFLLQFGITGSTSVTDALNIFVLAGTSFLTVYFTKNKV